ncbi:MAG: hypothetical protein ACI901_001691, partial [Octadecabacter sp.]
KATIIKVISTELRTEISVALLEKISSTWPIM